MRRFRFLRPFLWPAALIFAAGCATTGVYYDRVSGLVRDERYAAASEFARDSYEQSYGAKNELLYCLDSAFLLHLAADYQKSNERFERAKTVARELYTKSVSAEAATFLVSDNMRAYPGEDFELALIHVFSALNYVFLGKDSDALVELRQLDQFLKTLETRYDGKTAYKEDAFARYLAGMIYENTGETNDAHVSYLRALEAYGDYLKNYAVPLPRALAEDAARTAEKLGMISRAQDIRNKYGADRSGGAPASSAGEIVIIIYNGFAPVKIDSFFEISFGRAWAHVGSFEARGEEESQVAQARRLARSIAATDQIVMAFPKYVSSEYRAKRFSVEAVAVSSAPETAAVPIASSAAASRASAEPAEDIGAIAVKSLDERIGRIRIKTIARSAVKYALSKKIGSEIGSSSGDKALGWLAQKLLASAAAATELADKRSWRVLPDKIFVARVPAPPGSSTVTVDFYDESGMLVASRKIDSVNVPKGKKTFVAIRAAI